MQKQSKKELKSAKDISIMASKDIKPGLFGQKHSSRDYTKAECWGKNQFPSSFPASLVAYMYSKNIKPVYIKTDRENNIIHSSIESLELLGIDPLSDEAYYNFEAGFAPYEKFYQGEREKIDLVMMNNTTNELLSGLEIKLTALPDSRDGVGLRNSDAPTDDLLPRL